MSTDLPYTLHCLRRILCRSYAYDENASAAKSCKLMPYAERTQKIDKDLMELRLQAITPDMAL